METVLYDKRDRMAFVTLNRPERKNAIDPDMHQDLCRIWADFRDDDDLDVAILRGAGDAFCSGADLASYVPANYVSGPSDVSRRRLTHVRCQRRHHVRDHPSPALLTARRPVGLA